MEQRPGYERLATKLLRRVGTARARDLVVAGVYRSQLSRMVRDGRLIRLERGLYALSAPSPKEHASLLAVATRAPHVLFCLLTALRIHDLTTQAPHEVWIAIANKQRVPSLAYPPIRAVRFSRDSLAAGVEERIVDSVPIRVTNVAKTVADCFKFRNKIGLDVAIEALRDARDSKRFSSDELWRYARVNRVSTVIRPYMEAIS